MAPIAPGFTSVEMPVDPVTDNELIKNSQLCCEKKVLLRFIPHVIPQIFSSKLVVNSIAFVCLWRE